MHEPLKPVPNRIKILTLPYREVINCVLNWEKDHQFLNLRKLKLPADTRCLSAQPDPSYAGFSFVLESQEWPEVADGCELERIMGEFEVVRLKLEEPKIEGAKS
jgi:hypothetical protein